MERALQGVDVWFTGLRRSQSSAREKIQVVEWDWKYQLIKVSPLAGWERKDVWDYIRRHQVPYNPLHEAGYPSIGCTHCTVPVPGAGVEDYSRDGRWPGKPKTACGLHGDAI
jgi:phosphoadenosine phosphosulfate reductase